MPVATTDGILGLEARHRWNNALSLNDWQDGGWPNYKLRRIRGLHDLPDSDDNRELATEAIGEVVYDSFARGKTVTYEGVIRGRTLAELRYGAQLLRNAFGPDLSTGLNPERRMVVIPNATYGTVQHTFTAQCRLCTIEDEQAHGPSRYPTPYVRQFVIDLRLSDPRIYEWDPGTSTASNPKW